MEAAWIETFYQETDAPKRLELLKQNTENELTQADVFRKKLWVARYGKRKPTKDAFVRSLMELSGRRHIVRFWRTKKKTGSKDY